MNRPPWKMFMQSILRASSNYLAYKGILTQWNVTVGYCFEHVVSSFQGLSERLQRESAVWQL